MTKRCFLGSDRTEESFRGFFKILPESTLKGIQYVCSDMWSNYLKVAMEEAGQAVQIIDRFHVMEKFNEMVNAVRAIETKQLKAAKSCNFSVKAKLKLASAKPIARFRLCP